MAGLNYPERADTLIIPDPNNRVEAVINNQGVALDDALIEREVDAQRLYRLSDVDLSDYRYFLVYSSNSASNPVAEKFSRWILSIG
ncbi:MAG: DNA-binding transcriptional LysR family regulator [Granulosicoccus sp.]|jgi:DNA-binding transcriptional LysR family regulator